MPSPFPGMDPYLERPDLWQGFHNAFITYLRDTLQAGLPAGYVATLEVRVYLEHALEGPVGGAAQRVPDVEVLRERSPGGAAVLAPPEPLAAERGFWVPDPFLERREAFITVRALDTEELVTTLELLSPSNKRPGPGRASYRARQESLLAGYVNLVEVDLLRGGEATVAAPAEGLARLPAHDYRYCVYRRHRPGGYQVIPFGLREPLSPLPVPLGAEDPEGVVDLQAVLGETYARGRFDWLLRRREMPEPALSPEDAAWARERLAAAAGETNA